MARSASLTLVFVGPECCPWLCLDAGPIAASFSELRRRGTLARFGQVRQGTRCVEPHTLTRLKGIHLQDGCGMVTMVSEQETTKWM